MPNREVEAPIPVTLTQTIKCINPQHGQKDQPDFILLDIGERVELLPHRAHKNRKSILRRTPYMLFHPQVGAFWVARNVFKVRGEERNANGSYVGDLNHGRTLS